MFNATFALPTIGLSLVTNIMNLSKLLLLTITLVFLALKVNASELNNDSLGSSIEALKKEVILLNQELRTLEEDLIFPPNTQFSIFLSMKAGQFFTLESVQLNIDEKNIANHLYSQGELAALNRGGVQRLYIGNLPSGEHQIVAIFTGFDPNGRDFKRDITIVIDKTSLPQFVEFTVIEESGKKQLGIDARAWK